MVVVDRLLLFFHRLRLVLENPPFHTMYHRCNSCCRHSHLAGESTVCAPIIGAVAPYLNIILVGSSITTKKPTGCVFWRTCTAVIQKTWLQKLNSKRLKTGLRPSANLAKLVLTLLCGGGINAECFWLCRLKHLPNWSVRYRLQTRLYAYLVHIAERNQW